MRFSKKFLAMLLCLVTLLCATVCYAYADDFETDPLPLDPTNTTASATTTKAPSSNGDYNTDVVTPCIKHSYDSGKVIKKATKKASGSIVYTCKNCGATKSSAINKIGTVKLSSASYVYNGKVKAPSIIVKDSKGNKISSSYYSVSTPSGRKKVGKYTYKITFKSRYSGSYSLSFSIKPKSTSITSLTRGKRKFTVKWAKKSTQVTGYQIQYSTVKSFKNAKKITISDYKKTSKTISGLKSGKKYYVRIRTYKTVKGTKYYSSWSSVKRVTTK